MLNPNLIRTRCQEITDSVARLRRIEQIPAEQFLADLEAFVRCVIALLQAGVTMGQKYAYAYNVTNELLAKCNKTYSLSFRPK